MESVSLAESVNLEGWPPLPEHWCMISLWSMLSVGQLCLDNRERDGGPRGGRLSEDKPTVVITVELSCDVATVLFVLCQQFPGIQIVYGSRSSGVLW